MKTNTKRRAGWIVVALLLLAIISADLYFTGRRNINSGNPVTGPTTVPATDGVATVSPANASNDQNPVANNTPVASVRTVNRRYAHSRRRKHNKVLSTDNQYSRSADYTGMAVNTPKKPENIAHQTSHDHYGYVPVNSETGTKIHRVHFGLEAGYNQNGMSHSQVSPIQRNGFHAGGIVDIAMSNHFSFQPGLLYTEKGNQTQSELDVNTKEKLTLNYLEVPLDVVLKCGQVGDARILIGAGPYFAYLLRATDNFQTSNTGDGDVDYVPAPPYYNVSRIRTFDYGLGGFVGAEIPEGLYFKAGGELGLRNIQETAIAGNYTDRNYSFLVSIGYLIGYEK